MSRGLIIKDKEGNKLSINKVDEEICNLLGNPVDKKWYCPLKIKSECKNEFEYLSAPNWFDALTWPIANDGKTLDTVMDYYEEGMKDFLGKKDEDGTLITMEYIYPNHYKVINYLKEQGYVLEGVDLH